MKAHPFFLQRGFTLIETIVSLVLLGILSMAMMTLNGNLFLRSNEMRNAHQGTQLLQACMDQLISVRKTAGFSGIKTTSCSNLGGATDLSVAVDDACPTNLSSLSSSGCKQVKITATGMSSTVTLLFVNY